MRVAALILHRLLEGVTIGLLVALAGVVVSAVIARYIFNSSLPWYDEVASVMLAWITYYGAGLAALRRGHLGFTGLVMKLGQIARAVAFIIAEIIVYAVFITMAYAGWYVLRVMEGEHLVSLEWVSVPFTQSVVPIGCALFVLAQILSTPGAWQRAWTGRDAEADEIAEEIARAEAEMARKRRDP